MLRAKSLFKEIDERYSTGKEVSLTNSRSSSSANSMRVLGCLVSGFFERRGEKQLPCLVQLLQEKAKRPMDEVRDMEPGGISVTDLAAKGQIASGKRGPDLSDQILVAGDDCGFDEGRGTFVSLPTLPAR